MYKIQAVEVLILPNGKRPFIEWLHSLDPNPQAKILASIDRMALGGSRNNIKGLGDGLFEVRLMWDPGFRVYFGQERTTAILLNDGSKPGQTRDIEKAKIYWRMHVQNR